MRCGKVGLRGCGCGGCSRNPHECAVAKVLIRLSTVFNLIRRNPHECAVAKTLPIKRSNSLIQSQPARMRCGKERALYQPCTHQCRRNPHECAVAKFAVAFQFEVKRRRNPRECAVAKSAALSTLKAIFVATRTNALWQRPPLWFLRVLNLVATRTNALWQSSVRLP